MGHTFTCCCCPPNNDELPDITFTFQLKCCVNNINSEQVDGAEEVDNQLNDDKQQHADDNTMKKI